MSNGNNMMNDANMIILMQSISSFGQKLAMLEGIEKSASESSETLQVIAEQTESVPTFGKKMSETNNLLGSIADRVNSLIALNEDEIKQAVKDRQKSNVRGSEYASRASGAGLKETAQTMQGNAKNKGKKSLFGMLGGVGNLLGGAGMGMLAGGAGIGLAGAGIGAAVMSLTQLMKAIQEFDANTIKDNVAILLSIDDLVEANGDSFIGDSAKFTLAMSGLGAGLAAFGIGAGIGGAGNAIARFSTIGEGGNNWSETLKGHVMTLLSIAPEVESTGSTFAGEIGTFFLSMSGIAMGLAVFGLGSGIAGLGNAIARFSTIGEGGNNWSETLKRHVLTLLSISDDVEATGSTFAGKAGTFFISMSGIALGLAAFSAGNVIGSFVEGVGALWGKLTGGKSPIENILDLADNVDNLGNVGPALSSAAKGMNDMGKAMKYLSKGNVKQFRKFLDALQDEKEGLRELRKFVSAMNESDRPRSRLIKTSDYRAKETIDKELLKAAKEIVAHTKRTADTSDAHTGQYSEMINALEEDGPNIAPGIASAGKDYGEMRVAAHDAAYSARSEYYATRRA